MPNRRVESKARRDLGRGCGCYRTKTVKCPDHRPSVTHCDACNSVILAGQSWVQSGIIDREPVSRPALVTCAPCAQSWREAEAVALDAWLESRKQEPLTAPAAPIAKP